MVGTVFGRWDFAAANRIIAPMVMAISGSAFLVVSVFLHTPWGRDGLYVFSIIGAAVCLLIVTLTSGKMIGTKNEDAVEQVERLMTAREEMKGENK